MYELQTYDPALPADWEDNQHPMRAMPLVNVLRTSLWTTVPNFFGAQPAPAADEYNLSASAERSPNAQAVLRLNRDAVQQGLNSMVDGDSQTAFEVKNVLAVGVLLILDLGARFGIPEHAT